MSVCPLYFFLRRSRHLYRNLTSSSWRRNALCSAQSSYRFSSYTFSYTNYTRAQSLLRRKGIMMVVAGIMPRLVNTKVCPYFLHVVHLWIERCSGIVALLEKKSHTHQHSVNVPVCTCTYVTLNTPVALHYIYKAKELYKYDWSRSIVVHKYIQIQQTKWTLVAPSL